MRISTEILALGMFCVAMAAPIEAASAVMAPTEAVRQDAPQVRPRLGGIDIEIPGESSVHVDIFAVTGQSVKSFDAQPGVSPVDLPSGIYIVRAGHTAKTVKVQ